MKYIFKVLHNLNMLKASNSSLSYDDAKSHSDRTQKDVNLGIFEIARKVGCGMAWCCNSFRNILDFFLCDLRLGGRHFCLQILLN